MQKICRGSEESGLAAGSLLPLASAVLRSHKAVCQYPLVWHLFLSAHRKSSSMAEAQRGTQAVKVRASLTVSVKYASASYATACGGMAGPAAGATRCPLAASQVGLAQMLKGGVIMDVVTAEEARIAEEAGAVAVMALERVPADIRRNGGVARMSDPQVCLQLGGARPASELEGKFRLDILWVLSWRPCG